MEICIHLVEDEVNLNQILCSYLRKEGWQVRSFLDGESARRSIAERPHLWIVDIMLPGVDGYQLLREIKAYDAWTPVIFISARDADIDRIVGLEMGSDDYLAKPFLPRELVVRARRVLERVYESHSPLPTRSSPMVSYPPYRVDIQARQVHGADQAAIDLTSKEFDLLSLFLRHLGQPLAREQVLAHVWGDDYFGSDRVVDDLVRRVRKKMPELRLETIYGFGYRLVKL